MRFDDPNKEGSQKQEPTHPEDNGGKKSGATFTQEEVNRIVSDRLAREREKMANEQREREGSAEQRVQELQTQLDNINYSNAVKEATGGLQFSSKSARKAFMEDLTAKKLPVQDGKLVGMDDYIKSYLEDDPDAFTVEAEDDDTPIAVRGGTGRPGGGAGFDPIAAAFRRQ